MDKTELIDLINKQAKALIKAIEESGSIKEEKRVYSDQELEQAKAVIEHLNILTSKKFSVSAKTNIKHIIARLRSGFSVEDCKNVITLKCNEWRNDKMESYLNPTTLFREGNFERYLNAKSANKKVYL